MIYRNFLIANTLFSLGVGMSGAYWIVRINEIVGVQYFGLAMSIAIITQSLAALAIGAHVVKHLRALVGAQIIFAIITTALTASHLSFYSVFIIEAAFGVVTAVQIVCSSVLVAEITEKKEKLGKQFGYFYSLQGVAVGVSMIGGSFLVTLSGIHSVFVTSAILMFCSALLLIFHGIPGRRGTLMEIRG